MGNRTFPNCPHCTEREMCYTHAQQLTNQIVAEGYNQSAEAYRASQRRRGGWCPFVLIVGVSSLVLDVWLIVDVFL